MQLLSRFNPKSPSIKFAIVGCTGFIVDITMFFIFHEVFKMELMLARGLAFTIAATSNWFFNRSFTFSSRGLSNKKSSEWIKYFTSAVLSAIPNLGTFYLLINILPLSRPYIIFAMCCGIAIGYYSNYRLANDWVFKPRIT